MTTVAPIAEQPKKHISKTSAPTPCLSKDRCGRIDVGGCSLQLLNVEGIELLVLGTHQAWRTEDATPT
jgi:hypothetical protein